MSSKKIAAKMLKHFEIPDNAEGNFKAICKHCGNEASMQPLACMSILRGIT